MKYSQHKNKYEIGKKSSAKLKENSSNHFEVKMKYQFAHFSSFSANAIPIYEINYWKICRHTLTHQSKELELRKKSRNHIQVLRFSNIWKWIWFRRPNKTITSRTRHFSWKCNQFSDYPNLNYVKCLNENANQWTMHSYQCYNRMPINQYRTYKLINKQKCNGMLLHFQLYRNLRFVNNNFQWTFIKSTENIGERSLILRIIHICNDGAGAPH